MRNNEMNIINDLDKENDDLMRHLGILQQFSLEQETNILKDIKNYNDYTNDYENENNEQIHNIYNNNNIAKENESKFIQNNNKKKNKKIMDMIRKKEEIDKKKKEQKNNINNNYLYDKNDINNFIPYSQYKNEDEQFNKNFEIFEDNEKCVININNYNKTKKENNNINNKDYPKEKEDNSSSSDEFGDLGINNKLIEDALNVEKKLSNHINNFKQLKNQNNKEQNENLIENKIENDYLNDTNNKKENRKFKINNCMESNEDKEIIEDIENKNRLNIEKDIIDKYNLDEDDLASPKSNQNLSNLEKYEKMNEKLEDDNYDQYIFSNNNNVKKDNLNEINSMNKDLEKDFNIIKDNKNKINIINDINQNFKNINNNKNDKNLTNNVINNNLNKDTNFVCDLDIFKKLQQQMNKKSEVLQKTIEKYNHKPKKIEIINENNLIENKINSLQKEIDINSENDDKYYNKNIIISHDLNDTNIKDDNISKEKININNKNLLEKINNIKNRIGSNMNNDYKENNINNNINLKNDKDSYIKKEIRSATYSYEPLIFKIPSLLLDDKIEEIEIYIKLEIIYNKLKTITAKLDFISLLRQVLNNVLMLKNSSFNVYMNLFNFILSLQINELNLSDCNPSLPCEYLKSLLDLLVNNKDLTDMIRIIIFLIKKYFPVNMSIILDQKTVVILKVLISYLKKLNNAILSAYINIKSIFIEINDFLFFSPPSLLSDEFPLAELYMEIYEEIRNTTDNIIKSCRTKIMKNELIDAIAFIKSKIKNQSLDYVKYLDYAIFKINKI